MALNLSFISDEPAVQEKTTPAPEPPKEEPKLKPTAEAPKPPKPPGPRQVLSSPPKPEPKTPPPADRDPNFIETKNEKGASYHRVEDVFDAPAAPEKPVTIPPDGLDLQRAKDSFSWVLPRLDAMADKVDGLDVVDDPSNERAADWLLKISDFIKALENNRKALVDRPTKYTRGLNSFVKLYRDKAETIQRRLKEKMGKLAMKRDRERRAAEAAAREAEAKRLAEERKRQEASGEPANPKAQMPVFNLPAEPKQGPTRTESGTVSTTVKDDWKLADNWREVMPREYLIPDNAKIKAAFKAGIDIPGIERIKTAVVSARTR